jgi:hypothetical protein
MGSRAGASTSSSLPERLRVIQRRLLPIETSLAVLRGLTYLLFGFVSLILALTYSRSIAPRSPAEWGAQLSFLVQRIEGILSVIGPEEAGFLALLIGVGAHSLVGPFLTVPYSAALGAAAGTRTGSNQRSVGLALSLRLGASLAGALTSLWGWALLLLAGMTITDAGNYPFVSSTLAAIILRLTDSVFIPIVVAIAALSFVALYALSQIVMARILARIATRQQVDQTQVPKRKERFAEILEAITPEEVAEGVGN